MKKSFSLVVLACLSAMMLLTACGGDKFPGYKKTANGLYYKFYRQDATAQKPKPTDFLKVELICYLHDSLYYDFKNSGRDVYSQLSASKFPGDMQEAYAMMHVGDSASFYVKADSVAIRYYDQDPVVVGLTPDDYFRYEVKLVEVKSEEAFQAEINRLKEQMMDDSKAALANFIAKENINVTPDESGIYIVPLEKGKGRRPVQGEKVEIDFSAFTLDGQLVGSTYDKDEKFSFVLGENYVIPGWEVVLPQMHLGDRVEAIIPCEMAYGEHQVGSVPPYSNMVYDIKLLKITSKEQLIKETEAELKVLKEESEQAFWDYIEANNIMTCTQTGLYFAIADTTAGAKVQLGQTARVKFDAYYLDGTPLGNSDQLGGFYEVKYGEHQVLYGLEEAIGILRVGEKGRFVLPYNLAYGADPYGNVPAYSNLVFDVELLDIIE